MREWKGGVAPDGTRFTTQADRRAEGGTYWNGQRLDPPARRCLLRIEDMPNLPRYWAREAGLVGVTVSAVQVVAPGQEPMYLFDGDGSGWEKVTQHRGSPRAGHKNISGELISYKDDEP